MALRDSGGGSGPFSRVANDTIKQGGDGSDSDSGLLKVLTFNVLAPQFVAMAPEYYVGAETGKRARRIREIIRLGDVMCVQEVEDLATEALEDEFAVVIAHHKAGYWEAPRLHGNAILLRRSACDFISSESVELSPDGNTALIARFKHRATGRSVLAASLHLECDEDVTRVMELDSAEATLRREQLGALERALAAARHSADELVIVAGDFNAPASTFPQFFCSFVDVTRELDHRTEFDSNAELYNDPVDLISYRGENVSAQLHRFEPPAPELSVGEKLTFLLERYGSDHMPVMALFHINGGEKEKKREREEQTEEEK